ncbi:MAG: asparagine synthase (glutamine-hydrolyzing) [Burkholderiales bacterium]|jgi:asparagine synthase (glutamine-hydrolysing)
MCGLVAIARRHGAPDARLLDAMADTLAHRGPDGAGRHVHGTVGLAHRRLAILDPAGGAQPMSADGVALVFNGAIVNHVELRAELEARGHVFRGTGDTEVLLRAYLQWGEAMLPRLEGMFAVVVHDTRDASLLVARDAFGIKPLYWRREPDRLMWASEAKALLAAPGVPRRLDAQALDDYLALQAVPGERTLFDGLLKLEPAHLQRVDLRTLSVRGARWWRRRFGGAPVEPAALRERIAAGVGRQLRADVPVGVALSGGLDSSTVAAAAARAGAQPLVAFTGAFREGPEFDETAHARRVAEHVGARLETVWPTEAEWIDALPRLARAMDEPAAGPGLFPQFMVARLARAHGVKVLLGGQGGDELFAGYARHLVGALEAALDDAIDGRARPGAATLATLEPGLGTLGPYRPLLRTAWRDGPHGPAWLRYFRTIDRSAGSDDWIASEHRAPARRAAVAERVRERFEAPEGASPLQRMLEFDLTALLPSLLQVEDRTSMAVGLESRVPLLDTALAQDAAGLADAMLLAGGRTKAALRDAAAPWLPAETVGRRDKMGFPVPLQHWARGRAREFVADVLGSRACRERGLFDPAALTRLVDTEAAFGRSLWGALQLELWHLAMIDAPVTGDALAA